MTKILTPRSAIERVLVSTTRAKKFTFYETGFQKVCFCLSVLFVLIGVILGVVTYFVENRYFALIGIVFILVGEGFFLTYLGAQMIPELWKMRDLEKEFIDPYAERFNDEIDLISDLASSHQARHLTYAASSFSLLAEQLKTRIALLVGAIDKVGIIPLGITTYFSSTKISKEMVVFGSVDWVLAALVLLYLFALRMSLVAQWLERQAALFRTAAEQRKTSANN